MKKALLLALLLLFVSASLCAQQLSLGLPIGHSKLIHSIHYNQDSSLAVTAAFDNTARLWDAREWKQLQEYTGHSDAVISAQISPDNTQVLTAAKDGTARLYDLLSGALIRTFDNGTGEDPTLRGARFSADATVVHLMAGNNERLFETSTGRTLADFDGHGLRTSLLHLSPDSDLVLVTRPAALFSLQKGKVIKKLKSSLMLSYLHYAAFGPRAETFLMGTSKGSELYSASGKLLRSFEGMARYLPGEQKIISVSASGIRYWTLSGELLEEYKADLPAMSNIFIRQGSPYLVGITSEQAWLMDLRSREILREIKGIPQFTREVHWDEQKDYINFIPYTFGRGADIRKARLFSFASGAPKAYPWFQLQYLGMVKEDQQARAIQAALFGTTAAVQDVHYNPIEATVLTQFVNGSYKLWDRKTGGWQWSFNGYKSVEQRPGTPLILIETADSLKVLNLETEGYPLLLSRSNPKITDFHWSHDGNRLLTVSDKGAVGLWNPASGEPLGNIAEEGQSVRQARFNHDGTHILTSNGTEGIAAIYETSSLQKVKSWQVKGAFSVTLRLSKDYKTVIMKIWTSASPNDYYVWNLDKDNPSVKVTGGRADKQVRFVGEDKVLVEMGRDGYMITQMLDKESARTLWADTLQTMQYATVSEAEGLLLSDGQLIGLSTGKKLEKHALQGKVTFGPKGRYLFTSPGAAGMKYPPYGPGYLYNRDSFKKIKTFDEVSFGTFSEDGKYLFAAQKNGALIVYNLHTTQELQIYFFDNDPNKWLHLSPDGYFDASPEAMALMYWTKGLEVIAFSQLKDRFWVPGLWERVMNEEPLPVLRERSLKDIALYPRIELLHPLDNEGKLGIRLFDQGGGYGAVKIQINGKEVSADARDADFDHSSDSVLIHYDISGHPFLKRGEVNTIEVMAYNADEYVISRPSKLYLVPDGEKEHYEPRLHALVVGTADYIGGELDLRFPAKDASSFAATLERSASNLLGAQKTTIHLLSTDEAAERWPTKANIKKACEAMAKEARPYDVLVLYFAGHGTNYGGPEGDFYYLTADAANGNLKDPAIRESVALSSTELTAWIKDIPALKQVLIFDACHSGRFAEDLLALRDLRDASEIKALDRMKERTGIYILSGSAADAVSYEASIYGQGLLTYALLFGMKGASLREGKYVDVLQLFQFAADKVPALAEDIGGIQKPEIRVPQGGESFDIGLLEEEDREAIQLPSPKPLYVRSAFQNQSTFDDDLGLSEGLNEALKSLQDKENQLVFVDASKFGNAYSIRGQYTRKGGKILLKANLLKDGEVIEQYSIEGSNKEQVIRKLLTEGVVE